MIDVVLLVVGLALLLGGGDLLVRGASALAQGLGVSSLAIGLTVVAFGTSAPELSINLLAALKGNGAISFGNIIGSNIANIGLILGVAALIKPLDIQGTIISREIPMMLLASLAALVMGLDFTLRHQLAVFDRVDGLILVLLFGVFLYYTISEVITKRRQDPFAKQAVESSPRSHLKSLTVNSGLVIGGLGALVFGGKLTVDAAIHIAEALQIPKVVIGLTIVAVGTSLPELVTSIMATRRGQTDLAIGNVVGSNIFNLLFVTGVSATVTPIDIPAGGIADLVVMTLLSLALLPIAMTHQKKIVRSEGFFLLAVYFGYIIWRAHLFT
ncbi:MAG: calcium/sodium antiporter [Proteobacteria bacterium]|nr:calcium/sodium antiporter [Pseudomonadota bacterium]